MIIKRVAKWVAAIFLFGFFMFGLLSAELFHPNKTVIAYEFLIALILAAYCVYLAKRFFAANSDRYAGRELKGIKFYSAFMIGFTAFWVGILCYSCGATWTIAFGTTEVIAVRVTEKSDGSPKRKECDFYIVLEGIKDKKSFKECLDEPRWNKVSAGDIIHVRIVSSQAGFYVNGFWWRQI